MFSSKRNLTFFVISLSVVVLIFITLVLNPETSSGATNEEAFRQKVRNAMAEINFPSENNLTQINSASNNLANFIQYRSGVQISQANKNLLKSDEQKAWNQSKRLTKEQLTEFLTEIVSDKLRNLTDAQAADATETLRGFNAPDLPNSFQYGRHSVSLRASGAGSMPVSEFNSQINSVRGSNVDGKLVQSLIANSIALEVEKVAGNLYDANADFFGGSKSDMTPAQALLISYSVVTDDNLARNQTEHSQYLQSIYDGITQLNNQPYASPQGHHAYGTNGYIFSSPANLLIDDAAVNSLLIKIQEKNG
jgi:hypothetical protein